MWKRYSDFRKLHGDLAYTHRNLFRRLEEFPPFPRAQVFGECQSKTLRLKVEGEFCKEHWGWWGLGRGGLHLGKTHLEN